MAQISLKIFSNRKLRIKKGIMGRKLFRVDFDSWCKFELCLERVEKCENARELHTSRVVLIRDTPYKLVFRKSFIKLRGSVNHLLFSDHLNFFQPSLTLWTSCVHVLYAISKLLCASIIYNWFFIMKKIPIYGIILINFKTL